MSLFFAKLYQLKMSCKFVDNLWITRTNCSTGYGRFLEQGLTAVGNDHIVQLLISSFVDYILQHSQIIHPYTNHSRLGSAVSETPHGMAYLSGHLTFVLAGVHTDVSAHQDYDLLHRFHIPVLASFSWSI